MTARTYHTNGTGMVAERNGRKSILIELNKDYIGLIKQRTVQTGIAWGNV